MLIRFANLLFVLFISVNLFSQLLPEDYNKQLFTTPLQYTAVHSKEKIIIDGSLSETAWQQAKWSNLFTDIEGDIKPKPAFDTKVKMLWDDSTLYVAANLQEPQLSATLTQHDSIIFHDNDFEIFIDPDNDTQAYFEIEVNALNAIFDLFLPKPYRNNGDALIAYDAPHLQSAVKLHGTLNNSSDKDTGWTVEMAIPLRAINTGFKNSYTPAAGSFYRINFSRVEWDYETVNGKYIKRKDSAGKPLPEHNWVWSPQGVINMHYPERWGYLFFGNADTVYTIPLEEKAKQYLWLVYYKQKDYFNQHNTYADKLNDLNIADAFKISDNSFKLSMESITRQFTATITSLSTNKSWIINDEGLIKPLDNNSEYNLH